MERFLSEFWFGEPFSLFSLPHFAALALIGAACALVVHYRTRFSKARKRAIRQLLAGMLIFSQLSFSLWLFYIGKANISTLLPLHLCSLFVLLSAVMLVTRSFVIYEFSYFLGTGGALVALITPDVGNYNFPHFLPVQTFLAHGSLLLAQVYMTAVEGFRPSWSSLKKAITGVYVYTVLIYLFNAITGANYLFISRKPDFPSPLDYMGPWPWYALGILLGGTAISVLLYLPFHKATKHQKVLAQ